MDPDELLEELERLAERLQVTIRYEYTGGRVGRCLLHGTMIVVADKSLLLKDKVEGLATALADLDYENVYIPEAIRELLERLRTRPSSPSPSTAQDPVYGTD